LKITPRPVDPHQLTHRQSQAAVGTLLGSAVGDALGAPFEFKSGGLYSSTFPTPVIGGSGEMVGGGGYGWAPGEFTDDTQMALALAEAIRSSKDVLDLDVLWSHFQAWKMNAADIGNTTSRALSGADHRTAARDAHEWLGYSASNGAVMRVAPVGIAGVRWGRDVTIRVALDQAALTHFDMRARWAAAIAAEVIRQLILGGDFSAAVADAVTVVDDEHREEFQRLLSPEWRPNVPGDGRNGLAMVCLAQAVWAVRHTATFADAVTAAVDLGDDADTVAAVTGALAGALYGIQQIPARWVTYVHGTVTQPGGTITTYRHHDLVAVVGDLIGRPARPMHSPEPIIPVTQVHDLGVHACNLLGAETAPTDMGVISLCRMEDRLAHLPYRREYYILDNWGEGNNPHLGAIVEDAVSTMEAFLAEGREVVVHCHGGRSRTGLILKAWYMRRFGVDHFEAHDWLDRCWPHYATWNVDFMEFLDDEWSN
jgi:ADP-ribosyl-[dinitrogen reductase] hydrolase